METIERIGPCDSQIEVEKIEDVRGSKREYIIDRAKKLMQNIHGSTNSREISNEIKDSAKMDAVKEYGESKLPCGDLFDKEVIVVEGRADVLNLLRNGVKNVIAMNGTKMPGEIKQLGKEKDLILFIDGDRGGKLIAQNVVDNAEIKYIAVAPEGKEVEELTGKEILMNLRKRVSPKEFFYKDSYKDRRAEKTGKSESEDKSLELSEEDKGKLKALSDENQGSKEAILLDSSLNEIKRVSLRSLNSYLNKSGKKPAIMLIDGIVTSPIIRAAEDAETKVIVAKNFATNDTKVQLLSL